MNCKQGDLAIVVGSNQGNEGKIVRCVKFAPSFEYLQGISDAWYTEPILGYHFGHPIPHPDEWLRPIRGQDGEDETLTWLDVPSKEVA